MYFTLRNFFLGMCFMKKLSISLFLICFLLSSFCLTGNCAEESPIVSVTASASDIQTGSPVTFSASVSGMENISSYSFYILKDGKILAKSLRSSDSK